MKLLLVFAIALLSTPVSARIVDRVVAVVNKDVITLSELEESLGPVMKSLQSINDPVERAEAKRTQLKQGLDNLVSTRLVLQEADRRGISATVADVDAYIEQVRSRQKWSKEQLDTYLKAQGLSVGAFREQIREQLVRRKVVQRVVGARVRLSEGDLKDFYKEKLTQQNASVEVEAAHILLQVPAGAEVSSEAAIRQQANEILARAKAGEDFAALAKQYSEGPRAQEGGKLGVIRRGTIDPVLEEAIFGLKEGQVGGPIRTKFGYHVVRAVSHTKIAPPTFEESEVNLRRELQDKKLADEMQKWVKDLKQKAFIEVRL